MRTFIVVLLICAFSVVTLGQKAKADFRGVWQLTESINTRIRRLYNFKMTIVQNGRQIKIKNLMAFEDGGRREVDNVYFGDGRGESNPDLFGKGTIKTSNNLSEKKLSIERIKSDSLVDSHVNTVYINSKFVEKWQLSDDGNTLAITNYHYQLGKIYNGTNQPKKIFSRIK